MNFRKAGILWNASKSTGLEVARELIEILYGYGVTVVTDCELAQALGRTELSREGLEACDLLLVLGGDGTILSALDYALPNDIPILGVNLGRMGFLTEVAPSDLQRDLAQLMSGDFSIDSRITMTVRGEDARSCFALNDVVVTRSTPAVRVLSLEVEVNGIPVDRISGDGLIVASATGSTAYSLSAGGPIIRPGLGCFVITPICPHTMNARPVVVSSEDRITIRVLDDRGGANAVLDGRKSVAVEQGRRGVEILRSDLKARFIRLHDHNYFSLLRDKLSEWTHETP